MDRYNIVGCIDLKKQSDAFGENIGNANQKFEEGSNKLDVTTQIPLTKKHIKLEKTLVVIMLLFLAISPYATFGYSKLLLTILTYFTLSYFQLL